MLLIKDGVSKPFTRLGYNKVADKLCYALKSRKKRRWPDK